MSVLQFIIQEGCSAVGKCFGLGDKQTKWWHAALLAVARVVHQELLVLLSMSLNGVITEVGKVWGGRLRPFFLLACNPDYSLFNCTDDLGNHLYISNVSVCQPENPQDVLEARKSWPSGHASSAFCGMVFAMVSHCWYRAVVGAHCHLPSSLLLFFSLLLLLSLPFQLVAYHLPLLRKSIAIRSYLILFFFLWAFIVALSRISDYFHHPEDVIAGGIVGAVTSIYVVSWPHAS